jgi:hypothetical protein
LRAQQTLMRDLLHMGATRIYTDYWTCNWLIFLSHERIICSSLSWELEPGNDRYMPYRAIVRSAPHPTYAFPLDSSQAALSARKLSHLDPHYHRDTIDGYLIYHYCSAKLRLSHAC